jgi:hypothetical protein
VLTAREVLALSPPGGVEYRSLGALRDAFHVRTVSLRTISRALGNQRVAVAVEVRNATVLKARSIQTAAQLQALWNDPSALMSSTDFATLYKNLKASGVFLKVNADQKSAVLIGTAASLASLMVVPLTDGSLHVLDNITTGLAEAGGTLMGLGGVFMAAAVFPPEPASPGLAVVGAALIGAGAGLTADAAIWDLFFGGETSPPKPTSSNDSSDDTQPDGESISVPDGAVWGDVDGDATKLADGIVSFDLAGTPDDFSAGQGLSIPGLGDAGDGGSSGGVDVGLGDGGDGGGWAIG